MTFDSCGNCRKAMAGPSPQLFQAMLSFFSLSVMDSRVLVCVQGVGATFCIKTGPFFSCGCFQAANCQEPCGSRSHYYNCGQVHLLFPSISRLYNQKRPSSRWQRLSS